MVDAEGMYELIPTDCGRLGAAGLGDRAAASIGQRRSTTAAERERDREIDRSTRRLQEAGRRFAEQCP